MAHKCIITPIGNPISEVNAKDVIKRMISNEQSLLKFAYLHEGADAWDKMRTDADFPVGSREIDALQAIVSIFGASFDHLNNSINLIHIGSGNGVEIPLFSKIFDLKKEDSYTGVDISHDLLCLLNNNFGNYLMERVGSMLLFQSDVELEGNIRNICDAVRSQHKAVNIVAASGEGTLLSNHVVLRFISEALHPEDYAIFSIDGIDPGEIQKLCSEYDRGLARVFVIHGLHYAKKVGAIDNEEGNFLPAYYDDSLQQIVMPYELSDGTKIILLRSFKPASEESLSHIFEKNGLKVVHIEKTENSAYGILCRKG